MDAWTGVRGFSVPVLHEQACSRSAALWCLLERVVPGALGSGVCNLQRVPCRSTRECAGD